MAGTVSENWALIFTTDGDVPVAVPVFFNELRWTSAWVVVARADMSAVERALAAVERALPDRPTDRSDATQWPRSEQLLAHVVALADAAADLSEAAAQIIDLLNGACEYLSWAEGGARGLALAQRTTKQATSVLGAERPSTLTARYREAVAYRQTGRASHAIALVEPLLADQERILGAEHRNTSATRHDLALVYWGAGHAGKAIAILEPLLADEEQVLGAEHLDTLTTRHELAGAYQNVGRVQDAVAIFGPLLAQRGRILGAAHPSTLTARHNLARAMEFRIASDGRIEVYWIPFERLNSAAQIVIVGLTPGYSQMRAAFDAAREALAQDLSLAETMAHIDRLLGLLGLCTGRRRISPGRCGPSSATALKPRSSSAAKRRER